MYCSIPYRATWSLSLVCVRKPFGQSLQTCGRSWSAVWTLTMWDLRYFLLVKFCPHCKNSFINNSTSSTWRKDAFFIEVCHTINMDIHFLFWLLRAVLLNITLPVDNRTHLFTNCEAFVSLPHVFVIFESPHKYQSTCLAFLVSVLESKIKSSSLSRRV